MLSGAFETWQEPTLTDWESIVRRHGPMALDTAWRILGSAGDTEDAVQEAFLDGFRLHLKQRVDNWGAILRRLAARRAVDVLRKRSKTRPLEVDPPAPVGVQPEAVALAAELETRLREGIAALPARQAEVFSLYYFGDLTGAQIAAALNIKPGAVAVALHKARSRLQTRLNIEEDRR